MDVYMPSKEDIEFLKKELAEIREYLKSSIKPDQKILGNPEFLKLMKISDKTAAAWRSQGKIGFSQEGKKIYYRMSDVELFLSRIHTKPSYSPGKKY